MLQEKRWARGARREDPLFILQKEKERGEDSKLELTNRRYTSRQGKSSIHNGQANWPMVSHSSFPFCEHIQKSTPTTECRYLSSFSTNMNELAWMQLVCYPSSASFCYILLPPHSLLPSPATLMIYSRERPSNDQFNNASLADQVLPFSSPFLPLHFSFSLSFHFFLFSPCSYVIFQVQSRSTSAVSALFKFPCPSEPFQYPPSLLLSLSVSLPLYSSPPLFLSLLSLLPLSMIFIL